MLHNIDNVDKEIDYASYKSLIVESWVNLKSVPPPDTSKPLPRAYIELCKLAVAQHADAGKLITPPQDLSILSDEYLEIYFEAMKAFLNAIDHIPIPNVDTPLTDKHLELYKKAIDISPSRILKRLIFPEKNSPAYDSYLDLFLYAGKIYPRTIESFPTPIGPLSDKQKELYIYAASHFPQVLESINQDNIKEMVIEKLKPETFIMYDYSLGKYFPEKYKICYSEIFKHIEYIVISKDFSMAAEIDDAYKILASQPKHAGKTLRARNEIEVESLLNTIQEYGKKITLIFIGHTLKSSESIGGFNPDKIASIYEKFPNVVEIELFGCKTASAKCLDEETKIIQDYRKTMQKTGFIIYPRNNIVLSETVYKAALENVTLDATFILILEKKQKAPFKLVHVVKNSSDEFIVHEYELNEDQKNKIAKIVKKQSNAQFKATAFQQKQRDIEDPLPIYQTEAILDIANNRSSKFDKSYSGYKTDKAIYPHLRCFYIGKNEEAKIHPTSLFGRVIEALKKKNLGRKCIVKGFVGTVFGDNKEHRFYTLHSNAKIYSDKIGKYAKSFFHGEDTIDRKKLIEENDDALKRLEKDQEETLARSLRFIIE